jgi:phospholipid transport system substrate-binding protein
MRRFACAFLTLLLAGPAPGATPPANPAEVVATFQAALLDAMRNGAKLDCTARTGRMAPVVRATFDVPQLAKLVMRRHWSALSDEQRRRFTDTLEQLIVATYVSEFKQFGGESFTAPATRELPGGRREVHTELRHPPAPSVTFDYVLQPSTGGAWRVVNVLAEGMSDLALRTAQYDSVMKAQGFDGLLDGLRRQIAQYRHDC